MPKPKMMISPISNGKLRIRFPVSAQLNVLSLKNKEKRHIVTRSCLRRTEGNRLNFLKIRKRKLIFEKAQFYYSKKENKASLQADTSKL